MNRVRWSRAGCESRKANQIGLAFRLRPREQAIAQIAEHIKLFWTPKMRGKIIVYTAADGSELEPLTREAIETLGR